MITAKSTTATFAAGALLLTLTGCGDTDPTTAAPATVTQTVEVTQAPEPQQATAEPEEQTSAAPAPTEAAAEEPAAEPEETEDAATDFGEAVVSERGYLIKEIGQPAGVGDVEDVAAAPSVTFTVTEVNTAFECTSDPMMADPPANGHYVAFDWQVETGTAEALESAFYSTTFTLSEWDMVVLDTDGKRVNDISGNAMWCADSADTLPTSIGPKQTASGLIVLDLPVDTGFLVIDGSNWFGVEGGGWEWKF